jgi:hypothetical protein
MRSRRLFVVPDVPSGLSPCAWCSKPSVMRVEVEPAVFSATGGVRVLKRHAIEADVCQVHADMVQRNRDETEAKAEAKRAARRRQR